MDHDSTQTDWTDLFLLGTVLFPGARMALRVFEPRYLDMVSRSLRSHQPFAICLHQADGENAPEKVATLAKIRDWGSQNGMLFIQVEGGNRCSVVEWRERAGIATARLCPWEEEPQLPMETRHAWMKPVLAELAGDTPAGSLDATTAGMLLAQALTVPVAEKLKLLLLQDPLERLDHIARLLCQSGQ